MARIGKDRKVHVIEPAPAVPDTAEPLTVPAPSGPPVPPDQDAPVTTPAHSVPAG